MDKGNELSLNKLAFNIDSSSYSFFLILLILLVALAHFLRKKINSYLAKRKILIEKSEEYNRRRSCRNDLRVF